MVYGFMSKQWFIIWAVVSCVGSGLPCGLWFLVWSVVSRVVVNFLFGQYSFCYDLWLPLWAVDSCLSCGFMCVQCC